MEWGGGGGGGGGRPSYFELTGVVCRGGGCLFGW